MILTLRDIPLSTTSKTAEHTAPPLTMLPSSIGSPRGTGIGPTGATARAQTQGERMRVAPMTLPGGWTGVWDPVSLIKK